MAFFLLSYGAAKGEVAPFVRPAGAQDKLHLRCSDGEGWGSAYVVGRMTPPANTPPSRTNPPRPCRAPLPFVAQKGGENYGGGMRGHSDQIKQRAHALRQSMTPPEARLWLALKARENTSAKFSRQIAIGAFVADFVCRELKLIVEVDGQSHDLTYPHDAMRTEILGKAGYLVIRFSNENVMNNLDGVVMAIAEAVRQRREELKKN